MKQPWEWDENDLLDLITNGTQESLELDYKECASLAKGDKEKNELSKDVSAFANSAGGTIVYGMIENGHVPVGLDSGYDASVISKEWLDQVINSRIQRRIDGVRINQVQLTTRSPGKVAYIVYVPQSMRAPHQAFDKKFYKRFNFESIPMEEYEIRDASRRSETPDLRVLFRVTDLLPADNMPGITAQAHLMPVIINEAAAPAEYVVVHLFIDDRLRILRPAGQELPAGDLIQLEARSQQFSCRSYQRNWAVPARLPVFEGVNFQLLNVPLSIGIPGDGEYLTAWEILSPRMVTKRGNGFLKQSQRTAEWIET